MVLWAVAVLGILPLSILLLRRLGIIVSLFVYGWKDVLTYLSSVSDEARSNSHVLVDLLFLGLIFIVGVCGFPGMSMIELTCGFVLGFSEALILSVVAISIVSFTAFAIGRYYLKDLLKEYLDDSDLHTIKKILKSVERRNGITLQILFRLMFVPLFMKNYGPAVIETHFRDFAIAVVVTTPMYVAILTFLGSQAKTIADIATGKISGSSSNLGWMEILPLVLSVVAGVAFTLIAYFEFKRMTREEERLESQPDEEDRLVEAPSGEVM